MLCAVSGGPDSLALAVLMQRWVRMGPAPRLSLAIVDHGLRPESASEAESARQALCSIGLEAVVLQAVLSETGEKEAGTRIEARARRARYEALLAHARAIGAGALVTAHHREDQAETVLHRLSMGSGLQGLRGMDRVSQRQGLRIVRPLLGLARQDLAGVLAQTDLDPAFDPMNRDPRFYRARVRLHRDALEAVGLDAACLAGAAERFREAGEAIAFAASEGLRRAELSPFGFAVLPRSALDVPRAIARRMLCRLIDAVRVVPPARSVSRPALDRLIDALAEKDRRARITLGGCLFELEAERVVIAREPGREGIAPLELEAGAQGLFDGRYRVINGGDGPVRLIAAGGRRGLVAAPSPAILPAIALKALPVLAAPGVLREEKRLAGFENGDAQSDPSPLRIIFLGSLGLSLR
ncbi:MAG: tRNA lysidine(34) synthetase TilS [Hyphomicrobiaceae bacterium]|nr:tRNA lysidine(34) synthetase TilS [Hyphomicrobiaceae bacterium]